MKRPHQTSDHADRVLALAHLCRFPGGREWWRAHRDDPIALALLAGRWKASSDPKENRLAERALRLALCATVLS